MVFAFFITLTEVVVLIYLQSKVEKICCHSWGLSL